MSRLLRNVVLVLYVGAFATALVCPCVADTVAARSHACCETDGLRSAAPSCCIVSASEPVPATLSPMSVLTALFPTAPVPVAAPVAAPLRLRALPSFSGPSSPPPILRI